MNNRKLNPGTDLPTCDICEARTVQFSTQLGATGLVYIVTFACKAEWRSTHKLDFKRSTESMPDGMLTVWKESLPTTFLEEVPCSNAARIARTLRYDAQHVDMTWRDSRSKDDK